MSDIRLLSVADAPAFQTLRLHAVTNDPQAFLSTIEFETAKNLQQYTTELAFAGLISPFGYYGFFDQNHLVGFVQLGTTGLPKQKHIGFIYNLYVDPRFRRQHVAWQLCQKVLQVATDHQIERIFANCLRNNPKAMAFYQRLGFSACGQRIQSVKLAEVYEDEIELVKVL